MKIPSIMLIVTVLFSLMPPYEMSYSLLYGILIAFWGITLGYRLGAKHDIR